MSIEFTSTTEHAEFYSPLAEFSLDSQPVEYREDPLTGEQSRVVTNWFADPPDDPAIEGYVGDGEGCFFCPENVHDATPEYPDFVGNDRGSRGEATAFPNLFPYAKHSNVVVLTKDHFRPIDDLSADLLADGLSLALEYVAAVVAHDHSRFASINMNFLPSSGSSVAHPHLQALVDDHGTNESRRRLKGEREYHDEHGRTFWADLVDEERDGHRYVGSTGDVDWVAPFAPRTQWHVAGVTNVTGVLDPEDSVVTELARGIENVLAYYADRGLNAYNFTLRMAPDEPASPAVLDIVARPTFDEHYVNDSFYLQTLHDERVVDEAPEVYAEDVAAFF